ncbi:hypothetical protein [Qipengyuania marisflavi]|uniref:TrbI/VirB10 family protein n=1 Tax=Qipengyuania marisflavi TaxID=2486356 RepID=A0A5S3P8G9_9SPHN|nr:hypothetical protein [Qipengyuania marisflavi]TMM48734.1 hypothetical protein FEV51_04880 [Qipengyuania marisflavi]
MGGISDVTRAAALALTAIFLNTGAVAQVGAVNTVAAGEAMAAADEAAVAAPAVEPAIVAQSATLPGFTPLKVMLNEELSSQTHKVGDRFSVTVLEDVIDNDTVVVPAGSIGWGEVTFATAKGGFGKPGILGISLRTLELATGGVRLDGRYREEGKNNNGAVFASWIAVGVFSGFIKGKAGFIEQGRELRARTGEKIAFIIGENAAPVLAAQPEQPIAETTEILADSDSAAAPANSEINDLDGEL